MTLTLLHDLLLILASGLIAGLACRWLHVSVLIGYLVVGMIIGQGALNWITDDHHQIEHFAETGVLLLLFSIGLEFSIDELKRLGRNFIVGGAVQMGLVIAPVAMVLMQSGMAWQSSLLIAAATAFSSTVLVFKALSEYGQTEQPHGTRAIGILLFQDAALIPLLLMVPLLTGVDAVSGPSDYVRLTLVSLSFVVTVVALRILLANHVIPMLTKYRSPELVVLFTVVLLGAVILAAHHVDLPPAVGAFAAGLIFNGNRWTGQIDSLVLPFRETFAAIFFVSLGLIFDPRVWWNEPLLMSGMLIGVIVLKGFAATVALWMTGMTPRHSIGMGVGLAHVGEFAFVLTLLGLESGVTSESDYQRIVSIAVGSLVLTPPLLRAGLRMIRTSEPESTGQRVPALMESASGFATVIGAGPVGRQIASQLEIMGCDVCLIDYSPINLHPFALEGFRTVAGDATQSEVLELAGVPKSSMVVVSVPDDDSAMRSVRSIRRLNRETKLIVRCRYQANARKLKSAGADQVVSEETEVSTALLKLLVQ